MVWYTISKYFFFVVYTCLDKAVKTLLRAAPAPSPKPRNATIKLAAVI